MAQEIVQRIVESMVSKLMDDINSWRENLRLKIEAELYSVVRSVVESYGGAIDEIERELMLEREHKIYTIMMDMERERLKLVEDAIEKAISKAQEKINKMRGTEIYERFIRTCLENASSVIGSDEFIVECCEKDRNLIKKLSRELKLNTKISSTEKEMLGIKASSIDGMIITDLTLETKLSLLREDIKSLILRIAKG